MAKSMKTTVFGCVAAVGVLLIGAAKVLDDDDSTNPDPTLMGDAVIEIIGYVSLAIGAGGIGFTSRDDDVNSEGEKVRRDRR